jgi:hypothetical protein
MYSLNIKNSDIYNSKLNDKKENLNEIKENFLENLKNDFELLQTIYLDDLDIIQNDFENNNIDNINKKLVFKLKLNLEFEVSSNYFDIIQELKIPDISEVESNDLKLSDKKILNLPYYISFQLNEEGIKIDIFIFWIKKSIEFFEEYEKKIINELNDEIYFSSFFFSSIEDLKKDLQEPNKDYLLFLLQEINDNSITKSIKKSFFLMLRDFFIKRKKGINKNNLILFSLDDENDINYNDNDIDNEYEVNNKDVDNNNEENDFISQMKKRSDRLIENSIHKKMQSLNKLNNKELTETENEKEYLTFFTIMKGISGEINTDRGSSFQTHANKLENFEQVETYMKILLTNNKIKKATHNIMAYRFNEKIKNKSKDGNGNKNNLNITEGFDDDGEDGAGVRLLGILQKMKVYNIFIVVSRWFGGTLLGNDRFKHINDSAKKLILDNKNMFDYEN